ncbi:acylphosphatase [Devosia oryziradicis]|uniref:Acylphosphatase n=1 Tax=Devosia oryziradicis TaxID=2801335 RepID=A0ABX7BYE4_9HYPH|nr:acylphosphatase [Devosia oryziradicis]QQR36982.1 acylphosphatase [Devosia oryziradicis]
MRGAHVVIAGRVQGVGFRYWVQVEAVSRGLGGWVRNRRDGSVEAVFFGENDAVAGMLEACWDGPEMAGVTAVTVAETDEVPSGFEIRGTA